MKKLFGLSLLLILCQRFLDFARNDKKTLEMTEKPLEMTKIARNDENISKNKADHHIDRMWRSGSIFIADKKVRLLCSALR